MTDIRSGSVLRDARRRAGLSQAELARRAGTTQSVVSAYEASARQPSLPTLAKLIAAAGMELEVRAGPVPRTRVLAGPVGSHLRRHRAEVRRIAERHGVTNVRVFGSVARGEDRPDSDIDLLVDVGPGVGLLALARCQNELESLLGGPVDLVPASDLKPGVAPSAFADVVPI